MADLKQVFGEHMEGWLYNITSVFQNSLSKLACAVCSFFGLQTLGFYGDEILIAILFKLMVLDLVTGIWDAVKNRKWKPGIFLVRGIIKFPLYALYLFLVASIDHSAERVTKVSLPILELFVLYLLSGEVYSVARHLKYVGIKVPEPLLWLAFGFKKRTGESMKQTIENLFPVKPDCVPPPPPPPTQHGPTVEVKGGIPVPMPPERKEDTPLD